MKILTHSEIIDLNIEPKDCYEWVSQMLHEKVDVILPAKTSMRPQENMFYTVMPSLIPDYNVGGLKMVTRYPKRMPSLDSQIILYDFKSGNIKSIMDANYITTMRTGAVAAHTIKLFGKSNFKKIGMIGLGNQARATMKVLLSLYPDREFTIKLMRYKNQHLLFEEYIRELPNSNNITFEVCNSYRDTVKGSDVVISSVTYFQDDICEDDCFDEGCLVVPIHTRGFMNCDLFFDKVYADDKDHVVNFKYFDKFKKFAEVSDVLSESVKGRENDKERIIVYNIGLSMHDIYFGNKIYELAQLNKIGKNIFLDPPKEKFWI